VHAIRYGLQRTQFKNDLIIDYISHQRRLFPALARTYDNNFALSDLRDQYVQARKSGREKDEKYVHVNAAGLKATFTWDRVSILQVCRECCGGQGFLAINRIGPIKTDADIDVTYEGDNTVLLQQVSRTLLNELKEQFKKGKFTGLLKFMNTAQHIQPLEKDKVNEKYFCTPEFQKTAFEFREAHYLKTLGMLVQQRSKDKTTYKTSLDAWNSVLDVANSLAIAHMNCQVLYSFLNNIETIKTTTKGPIIQALKILCDLFVISELERDLGFFVSRGFLPVGDEVPDLISHLINHFCTEIRPICGQLVDAFGFPDHLLGPIAKDYIKFNKYPGKN